MADKTAPSPEAIFSTASGFMAAKYLFVANALGVFPALADGPKSAESLAEDLGVPARTLGIVLAALHGLGLLGKSGEQYENTEVTGFYLAGKTPADLRPFLRFWDQISYPGWQGFEKAVREDRPAIAGAVPSQEQIEILVAGIEAITAGPAMALAHSYDFSQHRRLLDLGGGTGSFLLRILPAHPQLEATLLDLMIEPARANVEKAQLSERIQLVEADFTFDEIPRGHDAILISNVLHARREDTNRKLLGRLREAADADTRLLLVDMWLEEDAAKPLLGALMSGEFLVVEGGCAYTRETLNTWLAATGWKAVEHRPLAGPTSLVVAKPSDV